MKKSKISNLFFVFSVLFVLGMGIFVSNISEKNRITFNIFSSNYDNMLTGFAVHPLYSGFSSSEGRFSFNNVSRSFLASDAIIYKTGYYSINGSSWQSFTLTGTSYNGDVNWLSGSSSYTLPVFGVGEHYVIIYSCTYANNLWNCHDNKWQLIVINNTPAIIPNCGDNCSSFGYQCGVQNICGNNVNCGTCSTGYNCASGVCVVSQVATCNGVICGAGEYCSNGACLLSVAGNTYFVAVNGNDNNPGTFEHPWSSWGKAFNSVSAGDIVYFRGGIYYTSDTQANSAGLNGTVNAPIRFYNYPGEIPIMDGINRTSPSGGIAFYYAHNLEFKGLTIRNLPQLTYNFKGSGFYFYYSGNITLKNCIAHNISARGFYFLEPEDNFYVENCDSYNNIDYLSDVPGNHGDGFIIWDSPRDEQDLSAHVVFKNCRAWNNADDGYDAQAEGYIELDNCWAFNNGRKEFNVGGFGAKLGSPEMNSTTLIRKVNNFIAANNKVYGISTTDRQHPARPMNIYHNFAFNTGISDDGFDGVGFGVLNPYSSDELKLKRIFKNNLAYNNEVSNIFANSVYTHEHNSWDLSLTISDEDFVSLDYLQLSAPRKADGSLPDITFGHLKEGSDLIDAGVVIEGYHCATAGVHPGQNCVEWYGSAPDLGPFEYRP